MAVYNLELKVNDAMTWALERLRNAVVAHGTRRPPNKDIMRAYQSVPIYYAGLSVKHSGDQSKRQIQIEKAAEAYQSFAVPGWLQWLSKDCCHELPEWLTVACMGRTTLAGDTTPLYNKASDGVYTRYELAKRVIKSSYTPLLRRILPGNQLPTEHEIGDVLRRFLEEHWRESSKSKVKAKKEGGTTRGTLGALGEDADRDKEIPAPPNLHGRGAAAEDAVEEPHGSHQDGDDHKGLGERLPMPDNYFPPYLLVFAVYGPFGVNPDPDLSLEVPSVSPVQQSPRADALPSSHDSVDVPTAAAAAAAATAEEEVRRKREVREAKMPAKTETERKFMKRKLAALLENSLEERRVTNDAIQSLATAARGMFHVDARRARITELTGRIAFLKEFGGVEELRAVATELRSLYRQGDADQEDSSWSLGVCGTAPAASLTASGTQRFRASPGVSVADEPYAGGVTVVAAASPAETAAAWSHIRNSHTRDGQSGAAPGELLSGGKLNGFSSLLTDAAAADDAKPGTHANADVDVDPAANDGEVIDVEDSTDRVQNGERR